MSATRCEQEGCDADAVKRLRYGYEHVGDEFTDDEVGLQNYRVITASLCGPHSAEIQKLRPEAHEISEG